jgi:transcriptional regulator NrdR family protein
VDEVRRWRECAGCGDRFPTSETVDRTWLAQHENSLRTTLTPRTPPDTDNN